MRTVKLLALLVAFALLASPQLAKAEGNYIQVGFSGNAQLDQYHARSGFSYYAVGSVDGTAVQDRDGNTWPGFGVGAIAFQPTSDVAAEAIENIVQSVVFTYGQTASVAITFAAGIDVAGAVDKIGVVTTGLNPDVNVTPGNLAPRVTITGQTLTIDTVAGVNPATPVSVRLTFENFSTPAGISVGTFFVYGIAYGLVGSTQTENPELIRLDIMPASATFTSNSVLKGTFDEAVRINQTPSPEANLLKINAVLVKAASSTPAVKQAVLDGILNAVSAGDRSVTMAEVTDAIAAAGSTHDIAVDLNGTSSFLTVVDGGAFTPVTPPVTPPADNTPITTDTTIPAGTTITGNTVADGVTITNNGTMVNPTNSGTITGGTLGGTITNTGILDNVTLADGAAVTGGTITGTITGAGDGATLQDTVIDATDISNVTVGSGCTITEASALANSGLDLTAAVTNPSSGRISVNTPILADTTTGTALTLRDLMRGTVNDLLEDTTTDIEEDEHGNDHISGQNMGNLHIPGRLNHVETTDQPDGVDIDDDGNLIIITSGIAVTVVPAPHNTQAFQDSMTALSLAAEESENGVVMITLPGVGRVALRFGTFSELPTNTASIAQAQAIFSVVGDPSNPGTYHLVATYPDGATQAMLPFIHNLSQFGQLCTANGITYQIDPNTGVFQLSNFVGTVFWRGIPDYMVTDAPVGTTAVSVEPNGDVNGDGFIDYYVITPTGRQLVYSLPMN